MKRSVSACLVLTVALLIGCVVDESTPADLFPGQVGEFLRTGGPSPRVDVQDVDQATYQGPSGAVTLNVRRVGAENVSPALEGLPLTATAVGYDEALGQRQGVFFTFGDEYHAAWGNGDWVFVLSASTPAARAAFLGSYGY